MRTLDLGDFRFSADEGFGVHTVVLRGPESSPVMVAGRAATFRPTVVIARSERPLADQAELEAFAEASVSVLRKLPGFQQVSRDLLVIPAGNPAALQRHRFQDEHGLKVEQLQLYVAQRGPALVI